MSFVEYRLYRRFVSFGVSVSVLAQFLFSLMFQRRCIGYCACFALSRFSVALDACLPMAICLAPYLVVHVLLPASLYVWVCPLSFLCVSPTQTLPAFLVSRCLFVTVSIRFCAVIFVYTRGRRRSLRLSSLGLRHLSMLTSWTSLSSCYTLYVLMCVHSLFRDRSFCSSPSTPGISLLLCLVSLYHFLSIISVSHSASCLHTSVSLSTPSVVFASTRGTEDIPRARVGSLIRAERRGLCHAAVIDLNSSMPHRILSCQRSR